MPTVTRLHLQPATASSVPATISCGVSVGPDVNRRRSFWFEASALTCDPPTSTARTIGATALVGETLVPQLLQGLLGLAELEAHAFEDAIRLRELDLVVLHDLQAVAARVADVEEPARQDLDAGFLERAARLFLVVDDEPEVRLLRARPALEQGEELIAHPQE